MPPTVSARNKLLSSSGSFHLALGLHLLWLLAVGLLLLADAPPIWIWGLWSVSLLLTGLLWSNRISGHRGPHGQAHSALDPQAQAELENYILSHLEDAVLVIDLDGKITYASGAVQELLNYTQQELLGQHASILTPDGSALATHQAIKDGLAGQELPREWLMRRGDGKLVSIEASFAPLVTISDETYAVVAVIRDLSSRHSVEHQLRDQTNRFLFFLDAIPHLTWSATPDGKLESINRNIFEQLGFRCDEVQGEAWTRVIRPDKVEKVIAIMSEAERTREAYEFELELYSQRTGEWRWYRINGAPMLDEAGNIVHWYGIATDIDALVRTRQESLQRGEMLRSIVDSQKTYVMRTDERGNFTYLNSAFKAAFYQDKPDPLGQHSISRETIHPEDIESCVQVAHRCLAAPGHYHNLVLRKPKPGLGYVFTEWEFVGIADEAGRGIAVQAMGHDITQQKIAENERENLDLVVRNTDHGIVITDPQGFTIWVNEAFTQMSGYTLADLKGQRPIDLLKGPQTNVEALDAIKQAFAAGEPLFQELISYHRDGRPYWVELALRPIRNQQGEVVQYFSIERDITVQKRRTESLEQLTRDLTQRNQELSEFAYVVSHNLRAPVANIMGLAEILTSQLEGQTEMAEVVSHLNQATRHLDSVILDLQELLDMRPGNGQTYQLCHLPTLIERVEIQLRHQFELTHGRLKTDFLAFEDLPAILPYLQSILQNLISNSLEYRHPERLPQITVGTRLQARWYQIYVEDNGLGIDLTSHGEDIFKLYRRFHDHTDGKGLGLYLVKTQVESMGGKIEVESIPHAGTTFVVSLPRERKVAPVVDN